MTKLISWNVNGLRACVGEGFLEYFNEVGADVSYIQESKLQAGQIDLPLKGYYQYWNYAEKKGCSRTAMSTKGESISMAYRVGMEEHGKEGRVVTAKFPEYYVMTCYAPDSKDGLARLLYRMEWGDAFLTCLKGLKEKRPVIFCRDLNVAHREVDLKNPKTSRKNAGFSDEERGKFSDVLTAGFIDTYRYFHLSKTEVYSWWFYQPSARIKNTGQWINYLCASEALEDRLVSVDIHMKMQGSDHCPVKLVTS